MISAIISKVHLIIVSASQLCKQNVHNVWRKAALLSLLKDSSSSASNFKKYFPKLCIIFNYVLFFVSMPFSNFCCFCGCCFLLTKNFMILFLVSDSKYEHRSNCVDLFRETINHNIPSDFPRFEPFQVIFNEQSHYPRVPQNRPYFCTALSYILHCAVMIYTYTAVPVAAINCTVMTLLIECVW